MTQFDAVAHGGPEELFAAGWSACFAGALRAVASSVELTLPTTLAVGAEVDLGMRDGTWIQAARLKVSLPGIDRELARQLVIAAHLACSYSRATRGNVAVDIQLM